jgi:hypothetical protein
MTIVSVPGSGVLAWTAVDSPGGFGEVTSSHSGSSGAHIMYIDFNGVAELAVNNSTSFRVQNGGGSTLKGNVTLIW